jgi:hypothetical protein
MLGPTIKMPNQGSLLPTKGLILPNPSLDVHEWSSNAPPALTHCINQASSWTFWIRSVKINGYHYWESASNKP